MNTLCLSSPFWFSCFTVIDITCQKNNNKPATHLAPHQFDYSSSSSRSHEPWRFDQIWEGTKFWHHNVIICAFFYFLRSSKSSNFTFKQDLLVIRCYCVIWKALVHKNDWFLLKMPYVRCCLTQLQYFKKWRFLTIVEYSIAGWKPFAVAMTENPGRVGTSLTQ